MLVHHFDCGEIVSCEAPKMQGYSKLKATLGISASDSGWPGIGMLN